VRVLSLKQPWAWVVVHMGKDIENRRWDTAVRGDFLIHASKGMTRDEYYSCMEFCQSVVGSSAIARFPALKALPRGVIVGAARLVDVIPPCKECRIEEGQLIMPCGKNHGWHMPEQYGFRLENIRPSPVLVECKGTLGFFQAPTEVEERLRVAAAAATPA
jgi:hypothetical protein